MGLQSQTQLSDWKKKFFLSDWNYKPIIIKLCFGVYKLERSNLYDTRSTKEVKGNESTQEQNYRILLKLSW